MSTDTTDAGEKRTRYGVVDDDDAGDYESLIGPNGFDCMLTEPEDRRWGRDLVPVVNELNRLASLLEAAERERDAVIALLIEKGDESPPLWHAMTPDKFTAVGWSWNEFETQVEAIAAVRIAAGLPEPRPPHPGAHAMSTDTPPAGHQVDEASGLPIDRILADAKAAEPSDLSCHIFALVDELRAEKAATNNPSRAMLTIEASLDGGRRAIAELGELRATVLANFGSGKSLAHLCDLGTGEGKSTITLIDEAFKALLAKAEKRGRQVTIPSTPPAGEPLDLDSFEGHTPGPWYQNADLIEQGGVRGNILARAEIDEFCTTLPEAKYHQWYANALLIAAAPALLAELRAARTALVESREMVERETRERIAGEIEAEGNRLIAEATRIGSWTEEGEYAKRAEACAVFDAAKLARGDKASLTNS